MEVKLSSSEDIGGRLCYSCQKMCSDDWCYTLATECLSYDVLENDQHQDTVVCKTCHSNLLKMKTWRQKQIEDKCEDKRPDGLKTDYIPDENKHVENKNNKHNVVNSDSEMDDLNIMVNQEPMISSSDSNVGGNVIANEACSLENSDNTRVTGVETVGLEKGFIKCASLICSNRDTKQPLRMIPLRYFRLTEKKRQKIRSTLALDEEGKLCVKCYHKLYNKLFYLTKSHKGKASSGKSQHSHSSNSKKAKSTGKQSGNITKMYACGWCKYRSERVDLIVLHHYKDHQSRELDVVRLKSPSAKSPSGIGFKCESCDYSGQLRHQLHLHNDHFHKNAVNRDGITDCESDSSNSPVYPYYFYNMTLPSNYFQMKQKYKLKDVKIVCKDILRSGLDYLIERVDQEGISKICVDSLSEDDFVSIATKYRENVSYCDSRVDNYVPVDIAKLDLKAIETIIRY